MKHLMIFEDFTNLYKRWKSGEDRKEEIKYDEVDLDLPSGTIWASTNVGARNVVESGDFFAWGETESKESFNRDNWSFDRDEYKKKNISTLLPKDDAVHLIMGGDWIMPTKKDFEELNEYCSVKTVKNYNDSGVDVVILTKKGNRKKDKSELIFPLCGYKTNASGESQYMVGDIIFLWSNLASDIDWRAYVGRMGYDTVYVTDIPISSGINIRGVKKKK